MRHALFAFLAIVVSSSVALAVFTKRFDICSFNCTPDGSDPHFCEPQLDALNWVSTNGHMICMGTDAHRSTINGNGNFLGAYYNNLSGLYGTYTGDQAADQIQNYITTNFTNTGVATTWVAINEISGSLWPTNSTYRAWLRTCMARLHQTYGHSIILFAPFANPANNAADWVPLSGNVYIGIEKYLSGSAVNASGNSVSWCQSQYQSSKNSYLNLGIASSQLYLTEHFAQTVSGTGWGRDGVSYAGWDNAIKTRATAAHNVGFAGYCTYAWEHNGMLVSEADMVHFEQTYAGTTVP